VRIVTSWDDRSIPVACLGLAGAYSPADRRNLGGAHHVQFADYSDSERAVAVSAFDARFGEMERVLWCLSINSRSGLLAGESSPILEALVWTIKSWWECRASSRRPRPGWPGRWQSL
jgi:hypothetical protein